MRNLERGALPEKREGRARLTVRDPQIEMALAGLQIDGTDIDSTRSWGNALAAAVRLHLAGKTHHEHRRLTKRDAGHALRAGLRRLNEGAAK